MFRILKVMSLHRDISMATSPPISSADSKESSDDYLGASEHEVSLNVCHTTDLKERERNARLTTNGHTTTQMHIDGI